MIKQSRILKPNAKVPFLVEYFFSTYQDFLKNEHFVLFCLAGSSFLLGIYPNCFVRYFLLDLETLLQITFF
jgi:hypothetical protein